MEKRGSLSSLIIFMEEGDLNMTTVKKHKAFGNLITLINILKSGKRIQIKS